MSRYFKYGTKKQLPVRKGEQLSSKKVFLTWFLRISLTSFFFFGFYFLFASSYFAFKHIEISLTNTSTNLEFSGLNHISIETSIKQYIHTPVYYLFSRNNFFLFDEKHLQKELKGIYPLKSIHIQKKPFQTLLIDIEIPEISLLWFDAQKHYYVNEQGRVAQEAFMERYYLNVHLQDILQENPRIRSLFQGNSLPIPSGDELIDSQQIDLSYLPKDLFQDTQEMIRKKTVQLLIEQRMERQKAYIQLALVQESGAQPNINMPVYKKDQFILPFVFDASQQNRHIGQEVLSQDQIMFIKQIYTLVSEYANAQPVLFLIPNAHHPHMDLYVDKGYWIYFNSQENLGKQLHKLSLVLEQKIHYPHNLSYIDVRFEDKVYFKYKNE